MSIEGAADWQVSPGALAILFLLLPLSLQATSDEWEQAAREIRRLPPTAFAKILPAGVIKQLEARGCSVPQSWVPPSLPLGPNNAIRGEFAKKGQIDYAVLCSKNAVSSILVFWGGPTECPPEVASSPDKIWLQVVGIPGIAYSRLIAVWSKDNIRARNQTSTPGYSQVPQAIDHDGINDAFVGKASIVRYCYRSKWLGLRGSD